MLVVAGAPETPTATWTLSNAVQYARGQIEAGLSVNEAAKAAAKISGLKKSEIYKELL